MSCLKVVCFNLSQSNSAVEQRTLKPLVSDSNPPSVTTLKSCNTHPVKGLGGFFMQIRISDFPTEKAVVSKKTHSRTPNITYTILISIDSQSPYFIRLKMASANADIELSNKQTTSPTIYKIASYVNYFEEL